MSPQPPGYPNGTGAAAPREWTAPNPSVPFFYRLPVVLLATVVCCPAGIVLLWQSRRRPAALAALAVLLLGFGAIGALGWALRSHAAAPEALPDDRDVLHRDPPAPPNIQPTPDETLADAQEAEKVTKAEKHAADLESFRKKTAAERAAAIRRVCPPGNCDRRLMWIAVEAGATDSERTRLTAMAEGALKADDRVGDVQDEIKGRKNRERFAKSLDQQLLNRGMNPDAVTAVGPANKTLRIRAFFCSRQFAHDFDAGPARAAGFTRVECSNGLDTVTMNF